MFDPFLKDGVEMQTRPEDKVLNPTVVKLGLISLFADISSEMLYPVTPIFLTAVLGASMTSLGLIEGMAEAIASLLKTYAGSWSDRLAKRTPFIISGYLFAAVAKPLIGFSTSWPQVLVARGLDRTGKGLRSAPRDALLSESVSTNLRGAAFGWHRAMDTLGAAIGPLLAILFLSTQGQNLRQIYSWALIPGLLAVVISLSVRDKEVRPPAGASSSSGFSFRSFSGSFKLYLASWAVFSIGNSSDVFLLMKAKSVGVGLNEIILLYCGYNLTYALASPYCGGLSDRLGRKSLLISGLLVFALVYLGFSLAAQSWHFWILFAVYGLYMAATDGVGKAFAVDLVDPSQKATGLGALGTVTGLSTLIASTVAGVMWDRWGASYAFVYGAMAAAIAVMIVSTIREPSRESCGS